MDLPIRCSAALSVFGLYRSIHSVAYARMPLPQAAWAGRAAIRPEADGRLRAGGDPAYDPGDGARLAETRGLNTDKAPSRRETGGEGAGHMRRATVPSASARRCGSSAGRSPAPGRGSGPRAGRGNRRDASARGAWAAPQPRSPSEHWPRTASRNSAAAAPMADLRNRQICAIVGGPCLFLI